MAINVDEQVNAMAGEIDAAVAGSRSRTMSLATASAQDFGNGTLASWVDAAKAGVQDAVQGLAADAGTKATDLRATTADFDHTDNESRDSLGGQGVPR